MDQQLLQQSIDEISNHKLEQRKANEWVRPYCNIVKCSQIQTYLNNNNFGNYLTSIFNSITFQATSLMAAFTFSWFIVYCYFFLFRSHQKVLKKKRWLEEQLQEEEEVEVEHAEEGLDVVPVPKWFMLDRLH